jgi:hypothetical protein
MTTAKAFRVSGSSTAEIDEISALLKEFLDTVNPADVRKLLTAVKKKPSIVKTALKFV